MIIEQLPSCTKCLISKEKKNILIPTFIKPRYQIMFIEETPSDEENRTGKIGSRFWNIIDEAMKPFGVSINEIYRTSVIKCKPKINRYPTQEEVLNCFSYLVYEVKFVIPEMIIFFGKSCFKYFIHTEGSFETFNKEFITRLCKRTVVTYNPLSLIKNTEDYFRFKSILRKVAILSKYKR